MPKFTEFFLPSTIPDRKAAAGAVAAGFFVGLLLAFLSGLAAAILLIRDGRTPTALLCASITFVMTLVAIGTWKRIWLAPLIGLLGVAIVAWQLALGKIAAIVLIVPIVGGFLTAMRGIAFFKRPQSPRSTGTPEQ
jgi:O-antigen ligase